MIDLIGRPYRLGANGAGADGAIDCIHLVYVVQERLGIPMPPFKDEWYGQSIRQYGRDLLKWGSRIDQPGYDGDVLLLDQGDPVFAVVWSRGCLYINRHLKAVAWCPIGTLSSRYCFRMKSG